jgi:hypothetical protein
MYPLPARWRRFDQAWQLWCESLGKSAARRADGRVSRQPDQTFVRSQITGGIQRKSIARNTDSGR